ncbi:sulfur oxidation c-type cytochrome SoxX [Amphritea balenae]|uniref:Sulfur oxidation c-type cytochrome SoxX n=1 Tax=Amphritea balenae TaxID=452629 RepID=A0A3P1ST47_9GAMM|nr:sulfur oxidation c-type cytochrome SoxX [Amphritea balenae]RRD00362.1 sulfur oxidation c-type cytochrome SoxX [Amphritea balenae]GGK86080.1 sulfur oxidation c-type cytochrome SoxX [Amphritea balenae]
MQKLKTSFYAAGLMAMLSAGTAQAVDKAELIAMGKAVYLNKSKGNCVSCHQIEDADATQAGNQGPPIVAMKQRFPDKAVLRAQVWDATVNNPLTIMPPLGKHWILSEQEIDAVVEYVYQF